MITALRSVKTTEIQCEKKYVVAVLVPHKSPAMEHYVERIAAILYVLMPGVLSVKTIDALTFKRKKKAFEAIVSQKKYDFYLCIGAIPAELFCAVSSAGFTQAPGMILSDQEYTEVAIPENVMNSCLPNNGELWSETVLSLLPNLKKILLCGSRYGLDRAADLQKIKQTFERYHVAVDQVCITNNAQWKDAFVGHDSHSTVAITSFEPKMFQQAGEVAAHARQHDVFTFATNIYAIHEGVDFAFGYSETEVFRRVSNKIFTCLQQGILESETFSLAPSLHCNVEYVGKCKELRKRVEQLVFIPKNPIKVHLHANKEARR